MSENQNVEYKESWRDEYLKWICGFANSQGGSLYVGVNDNGQIIGIETPKELLEILPSKIRDALGIVADVNLLTDNGKQYIEIAVKPNSAPISYHGEYHYRSGSTKQVLTGQALTTFLLGKFGTSWDRLPVTHITEQELRKDSFDMFREQAIQSGRMTETQLKLSDRQLLENLDLLTEDGNLTKAAVLLFHHRPEKFVPGAYVKIGYFENDCDIAYQDEIHGSLISQAVNVIDLLYTKYFKGLITYEGITRVENWPYPREAVREAILNAIAHKNYVKFTPIQIRVYKNRLVISNDSVLPPDWAEKNLGREHKSVPYNPLIANCFYRAGFVESWGRGIQKIAQNCEAYGNKLPEYRASEYDLMVFFTAKDISGELTGASNTESGGQLSGQSGSQMGGQSGGELTQTSQTHTLDKEILALCKKQPYSVSELIKILGYDTRNSYVRNRVTHLRKLGLLEYTIPEKTNSRLQKYRLVKK